MQLASRRRLRVEPLAASPRRGRRAPRNPPCCRSCPDRPRSRRADERTAAETPFPTTRRCRCNAHSGSSPDHAPETIPPNLAAISPSASSHETGSNWPDPFGPDLTQRPRQTNLVVSENTVVGDRTLRAQPAAADVMIRIATHMTNLAVTHCDQHTTRVVTITRTRRTNQTITRRPSHQSDSIAHEDHELPSLLRRRAVWQPHARSFDSGAAPSSRLRLRRRALGFPRRARSAWVEKPLETAGDRLRRSADCGKNVARLSERLRQSGRQAVLVM